MPARELHIRIKDMNKRLDIAEIRYVSAIGHYVKIHTAEGYYLYYQSISAMVDLLDPYEFCQLHRRYIVALDKITEYNYLQVMIGNIRIPVGRKYRRLFLDTIRKNRQP